MAIAGNAKASVTITETGTAGIETPASSLAVSASWSIANGTAASQADLKYAGTRTLAAGANENLDLNALLTSVFGTTLTFVKLRLIYLKAAPTNPANLTLTRPASGVPLFVAASDAIELEPGAWFMYASPTGGKSVTAATADLLNVLAGAGGNHSYDVVLVGTSA
jgi:hypothetical protein